MQRRGRESFPFDDDPLWYKDAIVYEVHIRAFCDSDGDGVGDILGLIQKLDYLQDLGITALWLLPFYPSPLKDDGYDISDYTDILPVYGKIQEFRMLVREAHGRGIRVINELVVNHTSDQHPWFQQSRRARPGTKFRDFYLWSDTPDKYKDARIIFKDFEASNWTWDSVAGSYYWHRFYSHQPDLNYDHPHVQRAILRVVDFWLRQGVDGLRVDAVPYLFEREGTNCENLPETHAFLRQMRQHVDSKFKSRMLLAEANQWPEDAAAYFGDGDEFHMAFHFPLMPRMFMSIRMEDRFPVVDIMRETPTINETCQWALFLRNHDELTLEMVTDEERDYMYRVYAQDPNMRVNLGIRRRLAPLLNNDRRKIELMNGLLFSLPGTPVVYYGDEIGMGDNFYLGDRNGVRTPMQWSPDRNAGFSRANPQKLYLPVIIDPEYHYEAVNVEAQQNNPDSLLWWIKRLIALRKRSKAFSRGSIEFLYPANRKVLVYLRRHQDETILVVANLSRTAQHVHLDLEEFHGRVPVELLGGAEFAPIADAPYYITLGPHAFYWFALELERAEPLRQRALPAEGAKVVPAMRDGGEDLLEKTENWPTLERILLKYATDRRWFRGKARNVHSAQIQDAVPLRFADFEAYLVLLKVNYSEGESESYVLPLRFASVDDVGQMLEENPQAAIVRLKPRGRVDTERVLYDALVDKSFCSALLEAMGRRRRFKGKAGEVVTMRTPIFRTIVWLPEALLEPYPMKVEQSNTSVLYEDWLILKVFRRVEEGSNPDVEIGLFLTEKALFPHIAPVAGAIEYRRKNCSPVSVAILQGFVRNEGDAWQYTLDSIEQFFANVLAHPAVHDSQTPRKHLLSLVDGLPPVAQETAGPYLASAQLLGERTAQLHRVLASVPDDPAFAPEPFSLMYQNSIYHQMRGFALQTLQLLRDRLDYLPEDVRAKAGEVVNLEKAIIQSFQLIRRKRIKAARIRCHGDYHLGQVLHTGKDFVIIDFEGEPARPLTERRLKRSPLRDVAGMIRSFEYAAHNALLRRASSSLRPEDIPVLETWSTLWYKWVSAAFLSSYLQAMTGSALLPEEPEDLKNLLDAYLLDKAIYEIGYELNNRPDWVKVPVEGILQLMEATE